MSLNGRQSMVRIDAVDRDYLASLAEASGHSIPKVLHKLLRDHRRQEFLQGLAEDYARLATISPKELEEDAAWDGVLNDGLD